MTNMLDYLKWRGDLSFEKSELNIVDIFSLAQLPIIDFDGIAPKYMENVSISIEELERNYFEKNETKEIGLIIPIQILDVLKIMAKSVRFKDIKVSDYLKIVDLEKQTQIEALTYHFGKEHCIAFSGTDDTLVGWKENIDMLYKDVTPAQELAADYVNTIVKKYHGKYYICGHSKGGNLSIYSGTQASSEVLKHVIQAYSFDGPGVSEKIFNSEKYNRNIDKITAVIPQTSIVGRMFLHKEKTIIVNSFQKGFYQHDPFSWEIIGKDFIYQQELTNDCLIIENKLKSIINAMNNEERVSFCDLVYKLFTQDNRTCLLEMTGKGASIMSAYFKLTKEDKKYVSTPIKQLLREKVFQEVLINGVIEYRNQKRKK